MLEHILRLENLHDEVAEMLAGLYPAFFHPNPIRARPPSQHHQASQYALDLVPGIVFNQSIELPGRLFWRNRVLAVRPLVRVRIGRGGVKAEDPRIAAGVCDPRRESIQPRLSFY